MCRLCGHSENVNFTLREMGSHSKAPNKEVTTSDLHFNRCPLAAELGRAY